MKLIGANITLLVLMCCNLLITGQIITENEPYEAPMSEFLFEDDSDDGTAAVSTNSEVTTVASPIVEPVTSPTVDLPPATNSRTRSTEPANGRIPIDLRSRGPNMPRPNIAIYNTKPGVKAAPWEYDNTKPFWFSSNSSAVPRFDVKAIYHDYLGRKGIKCDGKNMIKGSITDPILMQAIDYATKKVDSEIAQALSDAKAGNVIASNVISSAGRHLITGKLPDELNDFVDQEQAQLLEYVAEYLQTKFCIRPVDVVDRLTKIPINKFRNKFLKCNREHGNYAGTGLRCANSRYRSYDGFCNNLLHTFWGKANVCHVRFLPPAYDDGIYLPRSQGYNGQPLPEPRRVSLQLHEAGEGATFYTPWHFTWGQYIMHDIVSTPQSVPSHGSGVKCCPASNDKSKCMPIMLAADDVQAKVRNCINFVRSAPCPLCSLGPRQQINMATSYIDHSAIYGSDNQTISSLRTFQRGLMQVGQDKKREPIPPDSKNPSTDQCSKLSEGEDKVCFRAGDARVNQQPFIQLISTINIRRHNQHARELARVNPYASDEAIFQEARRLTIAEHQHITYNEYLPILLGPELVDYFNIIEKDTLYSEYESDIDSTTWNECITAACRFGHSQVISSMSIANTNNNFQLRNLFFDPKLIHDGLSANLIASLLNTKSAVVDPYLTESLKNYLYKHTGKDTFGGDLAAFNIQRGRDHGIAPYVDYVKFCFGYPITDWAHLHKFIPPENVAKLMHVYKDFRDIDLFTGGLYEKKAIDADIGPTFSCIVGIQFYHLKFGDRYFYSHKDQAGSFTPAQLADIKNKTSLTNLLCHTEPNLVYAQKNAFLIPQLYNPMVRCNEVRAKYALNYNLWRGHF